MASGSKMPRFLSLTLVGHFSLNFKALDLN